MIRNSACLGLLLASFSLPLWSQDWHLLLESNTNAGAGEELFHASYGDLAGLLGGDESSTSFSQVNVGTSFSVHGFTSSRNGVHVLLESDSDRGGGNELFLASYDSLADFLAGNASSTRFSQIDVGSDFSVAGVAFSGESVHLLLESDMNASAGAELYLASYNSLADFLTGTESSTSFSQVDVGTTFGVQGITLVGETVHLLLETDTNAGAGREVFLARYESLGDFLAGVRLDGSFSQIDIGPTFGVAGFVGPLAIFADDFENGNLVAWSSVFPE